MAKRVVKRPSIDKVATGQAICSPGCAASRTPHSLGCKCFCRGVGHGMLYQAGLSDLDRARLRAEALGRMEYEIIRVRARFAVAPVLADVRAAAGKDVRTRTYSEWREKHPTWLVPRSFLKGLDAKQRSA